MRRRKPRAPLNVVTIPRGPWHCVLDLEWQLVYLGTDPFDAQVAAAFPDTCSATAERMGDAQCDAAIAVSEARRARSPKPTMRTAAPNLTRGDRVTSPSPAVRSREEAFAS